MPDKCPLTIEAISVKIEEMEKRYADRFEMQEIALKRAELALEKRLDGLNEWRAQNRDQTAAYLTRAESDLLIQKTDAVMEARDVRISTMRSELDAMKGRDIGMNKSFAVVAAVFALLISLAALIVPSLVK